MAETRRFAGLARRGELQAANVLGIVPMSTGSGAQVFRKPELDVYDAYYESRQYAHLPKWEQAQAGDNSYIPVRKRQPLINVGMVKLLAARLASKLVGERAFPNFVIEDDPDTQEFLRVIRQQSQFKSKLLEPIRRNLVSGSVFVRFAIMNGQYVLEHYLSKWCYPKFDDFGNLQEMTVKYVYEDEKDRDHRNIPKKKWYRLDLGQQVDILYDNPEYKEGDKDPQFQVVATAEHGLGFVQGEWIKTCDLPQSDDGVSLFADSLEFFDELSYSLSQSSTAVQYNQDPLLTLKNMDEDEVDTLIRSSQKALNLGKDGEASFLEAGMSGVEAANELRDKVRLHLMDITRIILLDPEKMVAHAQSGKAMEVLHGPFVELIEEMRPQLEKHLVNLQLKMALATLILNEQGVDVPVTIPAGFKPASIAVVAQWPPVFPPTMEDLQKKVQIASSVAGANILSRETMTRWLAKDFGVEDIESEIQKIASQPVINPFGGF